MTTRQLDIYLRITAYIALAVFVFLNKNREISYILIMISAGILLFTIRRKKALLLILLFTIGTFLGNILFVPGRVVADLGGFVITENALDIAVSRVAALFALIGGVKVVFWRMTPEKMLLALKEASRPMRSLRIPLDEFFEVAILTLRKLTTVDHEIRHRYKKQNGRTPLSRAISVIHDLFKEERR